jgi:hypothetical protein
LAAQQALSAMICPIPKLIVRRQVPSIIRADAW